MDLRVRIECYPALVWKNDLLYFHPEKALFHYFYIMGNNLPDGPC